MLPENLFAKNYLGTAAVGVTHGSHASRFSCLLRGRWEVRAFIAGTQKPWLLSVPSASSAAQGSHQQSQLHLWFTMTPKSHPTVPEPRTLNRIHRALLLLQALGATPCPCLYQFLGAATVLCLMTCTALTSASVASSLST